MYNNPVIVNIGHDWGATKLAQWATKKFHKEKAHLGDFHFTSQVEETEQLLADTAKHIGHFIDREAKTHAF